MGRPRRLTEKERAESNAARQKRWYHRHEGFARLKMKNYREQAKGVRTLGKPNEKVFKPNAEGRKGDVRPSLGELHYGPVEGYDVAMEPKPEGGRGRANLGVVSSVETENEKRTYARLEEFKARARGRGVEVELIL